MEDDGENFLDDDWDVPDDQLHLLEQNAVVSTQHQRENAQQDGKLDSTTGRPNVFRAEVSRSEAPQPVNYATKTSGLTALGEPKSFGNGYNDDNNDEVMLDEGADQLILEEAESFVPRPQVDETTQREQWRLNRFGAQRQQPKLPTQTVPAPFESFDTRQSDSIYQRRPQKSLERESHVTIPVHADENIRLKLEELRRERDILFQNLESATRDLRTAKGEIAVIRENSNKDSKSFERQMNVLRKHMQDEAAKHHATIGAKDEDHNQLVTDRNFLKHELDEQMQKLQRLQRQLKEKSTTDKPKDINITPKKGPINSINDGFNDDEVSFASPSKSPAKSSRRSKTGTPTNRKRKQIANDSDIQPLALRLSGSVDEPVVEVPRPETKAETTSSFVRKDHQTQRKFQLVQAILKFQPLGNSKTLIERLIVYSFPSEPSKTLSSLVLSATATLKGDRLPGDLLEFFVDLWSRALQEQYHNPISLLIEAINHLLDLEPTIIDKEILNKLLPTLTDTADINATVRFRLAENIRLSRKEKKKPPPVFDRNIDSVVCLDLLYTTVCLIMDDTNLLVHFWRLMKTDHVLLTLASSQPIPVINLMLQILTTSILPDTFGNICGSAEEQLKMETYITDRICFLFWENMRQVDESQPPYSRAEICRLRLEALNLLSQFAVTSCPHPHKMGIENHHGTTFTVNHPTAIARLVRSIYDEVDNMYNLYPTYNLHAQLVNRTVSLLHHLLTSPQAENFDLNMKLAGTPVGMHKFRVVLTRLAFRDGVFLDRGITEETTSKAMEILEGHVYPDEAVALLEAFGKSPDLSGSMEE